MRCAVSAITNHNGAHIREHRAIEADPLFELAADMARAEFKAPRERALYVRDDHVLALLTAVGDHCLALRKIGEDPPLPLLEMQVVLNGMVMA